MLKKILVAADGSDHARNAVRVAGNLAARYGAGLLVAHVLTDQPVPSEIRHLAEVEHLVDRPEPRAPRFGQLSLEESPKSNERRLAAVVGGKILEQGQALARREGAERVETLDLTGDDPAQALVEAVQQHGVELVVIGSRGFGPLGRLLHGSVSTKVSQEIACPCLVVK